VLGGQELTEARCHSKGERSMRNPKNTSRCGDQREDLGKQMGGGKKSGRTTGNFTTAANTSAIL